VVHDRDLVVDTREPTLQSHGLVAVNSNTTKKEKTWGNYAKLFEGEMFQQVPEEGHDDTIGDVQFTDGGSWLSGCKAKVLQESAQNPGLKKEKKKQTSSLVGGDENTECSRGPPAARKRRRSYPPRVTAQDAQFRV